MSDDMTTKNPIHERRKAWRELIEKHHQQELESARDSAEINPPTGTHIEFDLWHKYVGGSCQECGPMPNRGLE